MGISKLHGIQLNEKIVPNLRPAKIGEVDYDYRIERFAKTYPYTVKTIPQSLKNWYKYGITNYAHINPKLQAHDFSERAEETGLLPDATAIVLFHIREVMAEFEEPEDTDSQLRRIPAEGSGEGTIQEMSDLVEARDAVRIRVNPYLRETLEDADFQDIIDKFDEEEGTTYSEGERDYSEELEGSGEAETTEKEKRIDFTTLVLTACSGNYKTDKAIFEEMFTTTKGQWNPSGHEEAWYVGFMAEYDHPIRLRASEKLKGYVKQKIEIRDFDEKYRGEYALVPYFQGAKGDRRTPFGLYKRGYGGFVYLEIKEVSALAKREKLTSQICMFKVRLTDQVNLYPYVYDPNTLMYDGKILKEDILEKYVYHKDWGGHWVYNDMKIGVSE